MSGYAQLTIEGGEVAVFTPRRSTKRGLSFNQRQVMYEARANGGLISPGQAGKVIHDRRVGSGCGYGAKGGRYDLLLEVPGRVACCPYASTDGGRVVKRLVAEGMLEKISHGIYAVIG